jgi:hypothetical protein
MKKIKNKHIRTSYELGRELFGRDNCLIEITDGIDKYVIEGVSEVKTYDDMPGDISYLILKITRKDG